MVPQKKNGKVIMVCTQCGHKLEEEVDAKLSEKINDNTVKKIEVIEKEIETRPLVNEECPECGHKKAHFWSKQTRAGDEAETRFYKCEKCKKQWRDYS